MIEALINNEKLITEIMKYMGYIGNKEIGEIREINLHPYTLIPLYPYTSIPLLPYTIKNVFSN